MCLALFCFVVFMLYVRCILVCVCVCVCVCVREREREFRMQVLKSFLIGLRHKTQQ